MKTANDKIAERKAVFAFHDMPKDYEGLCRLFLPRPIHDKNDYANTLEVADSMAVHHEDFTANQEDYFDMLCHLLEAWDREHVKRPKVSSLELLKYLLENNDMNGADLSRILGSSSRRLGSMILRGERRITADHARTLGEYFCMESGAFL